MVFALPAFLDAVPEPRVLEIVPQNSVFYPFKVPTCCYTQLLHLTGTQVWALPVVVVILT